MSLRISSGRWNTCIVDEAVQIRVFPEQSLGEVPNIRCLAGIQHVVGGGSDGFRCFWSFDSVLPAMMTLFHCEMKCSASARPMPPAPPVIHAQLKDVAGAILVFRRRATRQVKPSDV